MTHSRARIVDSSSASRPSSHYGNVNFARRVNPKRAHWNAVTGDRREAFVDPLRRECRVARLLEHQSVQLSISQSAKVCLLTLAIAPMPVARNGIVQVGSFKAWANHLRQIDFQFPCKRCRMNMRDRGVCEFMDRRVRSNVSFPLCGNASFSQEDRGTGAR